MTLQSHSDYTVVHRRFHRGLFCSECDHGYRNVRGKCQECTKANAGAMVLLILMPMGVGAYRATPPLPPQPLRAKVAVEMGLQ